eukprot:COSAG01_NODE_21363_length_905_cov_1.300248_1_plen_66_part_00
MAEQQRAIKIRAFWQMGLGTVLVLLFSDPMVDCLSALGEVSEHALPPDRAGTAWLPGSRNRNRCS